MASYCTMWYWGWFSSKVIFLPETQTSIKIIPNFRTLFLWKTDCLGEVRNFGNLRYFPASYCQELWKQVCDSKQKKFNFEWDSSMFQLVALSALNLCSYCVCLYWIQKRFLECVNICWELLIKLVVHRSSSLKDTGM